ncbi:carbohydrate ABC transporter permease [Kribbella sandramycini]|uniref:Carbohydrate ABC transporter permease n=1 Tax=Kribbella sandramycini TaxID=60450 RepID=A0A7Y4L0B3_9ACTN|nr:carbohydrate ABC transporter permease [Kribbella sandramycini]MBB6565684.1 N-acetylglucosamine transport system permease protein [Kribbella sandramycini]NOL41947.1 carbohydrate ABC transporter permease [Kribbella sandramycini]
MRSGSRVLGGVTQSFALVWGAMVLFPLLWAVLSSFKSDADIFRSPWSLPTDWHWENFSRAWNESHIGKYFFNSVIVVSGGVLLCLLLSAAVAYVLAQFEFPGSKALYYVFVGGMVFPGFLALVPLFFVVQNLGLLNSHLGLILVYATGGMSFSVFFLTAFFKAQSKDLAEAALVDGCSHFGVLFRIMLPLARPGLVSIGIFQFLGMWNEYLLPLVLNTEEDRYLVTQGLANIAVTQGYHSDFSGLFAGLTISILPVLAVYLAFHRQISAGMTAGALK